MSAVAKLFDPLGWLGPIVILAKLLMQQLWEAKFDCDEAVSVKIQVKWKLFCDHLHRILSVRIPRWTGVSLECHIQLNCFSVAAEKEYYGTVFVRIQKDESCSCQLLIAKTQEAPLKHIPKLELCGAVLLSKLMKKVIDTLSFHHEVYLWTDSSCVLGWL